MGIYISNIDIPKEPFVSITLCYDGSVHVWSSYKGEWFETKATPVTDVRPVVRGKWTDHRTIEHDGEWYCTACGKEITIYMGEDRPDRYRFCPNCGADMREEQT